MLKARKNQEAILLANGFQPLLLPKANLDGRGISFQKNARFLGVLMWLGQYLFE